MVLDKISRSQVQFIFTLVMETQSSSSVFSRVFSEAHQTDSRKKSKNALPAVPDGPIQTKEAARRTGCSLRQLQWWDERGLVKPRQFGHARWYTAEEVNRLRVIVALRRNEISIQRVRYLLKLAPFARDESRFVLTDGKRAYSAADVPTVIRLMLESRKPLILIERHSLSNSSKTDGPKKKGAQG